MHSDEERPRDCHNRRVPRWNVTAVCSRGEVAPLRLSVCVYIYIYTHTYIHTYIRTYIQGDSLRMNPTCDEEGSFFCWGGGGFDSFCGFRGK